MSPCLAISIGDVTGVGPEVTLKALAAELPRDATRYLLLGDDASLRATNSRLRLGLSWRPCENPVADCRILLSNPLPEPLPPALPPGAPLAARAALDWLRAGAQRCLRHEADALVTAPVNKEAIIRAGAIVCRPDRISFRTGRHRAHRHDAARHGRARPLAARGARHHSCRHQAPSPPNSPRQRSSWPSNWPPMPAATSACPAPGSRSVA